MQVFLFLVAALLPGSLAAGPLIDRRDSCASVTSSCRIADRASAFCSGYLDVKPQKTTTRVTVSTVTLYTEKTASTVTTSVCPTTGGPSNSKRNEGPALEARNPAPTPAVDYDEVAASLEKRQQSVPSCLSKYTASSQLSSACNCYPYPETTSTRHVTRTTTLKGAPTITKYTTTVTLTTLAATPTCDVVSVNKKTGKKTTWTEFYGVCFAFRTGGNTPEDDGHVFPADTPLCDALNMCANATIGEGSQTFELSFNEFGNRPGGPKWDCSGYGAGPQPLEFFADADNWYETYGYFHN